MDNLKGELLIIKQMLNSTQIEDKIEGIKRVIISMSIGKNVTEIFQSVIKCLSLNNLKIKKLIYLYIINNSRNCPDDALMIINQFCKDAKDPLPIIRALAIRTMGCLRVPKLNEYLIDPLINGLKDESAYVRKTAILCVSKVVEVSKELVVSKNLVGVIKLLMMEDSNAKVVSTSLIVLENIYGFLDEKLVLNEIEFFHLLAMSGKFTEWDQIYVFEILTRIEIVIQEEKKIFLKKIENFLFPKLAHFNKALVLACTKLILKFLDFCGKDSVWMSDILKKISKSLLSLFNSNFQTSYVALQSLYAIEKKYRHCDLHLEISDFYCKHDEPLYVKLLKLKLILKISRRKINLEVFNELFNYIKSPDIEFSGEAVKIFFKLACLSPTFKTFEKVSQILFKMGGHLREMRNYSILARILSNLNKFILSFLIKSEEPTDILTKKILENTNFLNFLTIGTEIYKELSTDASKIGLLYLISIFHSKIKNIEKIIIYFTENFFKEKEEVELVILRTLVILFLNEIEECDDLLMNLFEKINQEHHNPIIRDQAFIYWRLLTKDLELSKKIFEKIPKTKKRKNQIKKSKKAKFLKISSIGTFINKIFLEENIKIPNFLIMNNYQRALKSVNRQKNGFKVLDMNLVHNLNKLGRDGKKNFEIFSRIENRKNEYYLVLDIKNNSKEIHELIDFEISENCAGLFLDKNTFKKNKKIQKNEICMIELKLIQKTDKIKILENVINSLTLNCSIKTNIDTFDFKIPFLLNIFLNQNSEKNDSDQKIFEDTIFKNNILQFEITTYLKLDSKLTRILKQNKVFKFNDQYILKVKDEIICFLKLDSNKPYVISCTVMICNEFYRHVIKELVEKVIYH